MKCQRIQVYGKVQGVWYRASTKKKADELGLYGLVRNQSDGSVYIEVCGKESSLQSFVEWCWQGPELAQVTKVVIEEMEPDTYVNFEVKR